MFDKDAIKELAQAEAIQRKFCEVNGLPIPADGKIGGA